jgi:transcriptional regulator GlxA family with amidase domain
VEKTPRQYASIVFAPEIEDRGWPRSGTNFMIYETSAASHRALRKLVSKVTSASSDLVDTLDVAAISAAIRESLLAAIDNAFADTVNTEWTTRADAARHLKVFRDVQAALSDDAAHPVYSGELAKQIGVSVRTMHDAVRQYRGMTLHRYLRVRRLWLVRKRLIEGSQSVKACALAFGFWHLGDFSVAYRSQFGETPSETLARSRGPSR